jgi:hypothetical protein
MESYTWYTASFSSPHNIIGSCNAADHFSRFNGHPSIVTRAPRTAASLSVLFLHYCCWSRPLLQQTVQLPIPRYLRTVGGVRTKSAHVSKPTDGRTDGRTDDLAYLLREVDRLCHRPSSLPSAQWSQSSGGTVRRRALRFSD